MPAVQLHQLGFHQLGGVVVPGHADGLAGAAYGFHQQIHDFVQHFPVWENGTPLHAVSYSILMCRYLGGAVHGK